VQDTQTTSHRVFLVELGVANREVARAHGRARVWDPVTDHPIEEALLVIAQQSQLDAGGMAASNAAGFYAIILADYNPASMSYYVDADAEDFTQRVIQAMSMLEMTVLDIDLPLSYAGAVDGIVRDASGDPLAGAVVQARLMSSEKGPWQAVTDGDGYYVLYDLDAPRAYDMIGDHPQAATESSSDVSVPAATVKHALTLSVDFVLGSTGTVSGQVARGSGTGVAGVEISAEPVGGVNGWGRQFAVSDTSGDYQLPDLNPGPYILHFEKPGYVSVDLPLLVTAGSPQILNVLLSVVGLIQGQVQSATGGGLGSAWLSAKQASPGTVGYAFSLCQSDGAYELGLPAADTYTVIAEADGYVPASQNVTAAPGEIVTGVDFILQPSL